MKLQIVIDPNRDEEILIYAHEKTPLISEIEELVKSHSVDLIGYAQDETVKLNLNDIYCFVKTRITKKCITVCVIAYVLIAILDPALYTQQLIPIFLLLPTMETLFNGENNDEKTTLSSSL